MGFGWLCRIGGAMLCLLILTLLLISLSIHYYTLFRFIDTEVPAAAVALLLVSAKVLVVAYYPYRARLSGNPALRPPDWPLQLLRWLLILVALFCTVSVVAEVLQQTNPRLLWLLEQMTGFRQKRVHPVLACGCGVLVALLLETAQYVMLQQMALAYLPFWQLEHGYRLELRRKRLLMAHELRIAKLDERVLRGRVESQRRRVERELKETLRVATGDPANE